MTNVHKILKKTNAMYIGRRANKLDDLIIVLKTKDEETSWKIVWN